MTKRRSRPKKKAGGGKPGLSKYRMKQDQTAVGLAYLAALNHQVAAAKPAPTGANSKTPIEDD